MGRNAGGSANAAKGLSVYKAGECEGWSMSCRCSYPTLAMFVERSGYQRSRFAVLMDARTHLSDKSADQLDGQRETMLAVVGDCA